MSVYPFWSGSGQPGLVEWGSRPRMRDASTPAIPSLAVDPASSRGTVQKLGRKHAPSESLTVSCPPSAFRLRVSELSREKLPELDESWSAVDGTNMADGAAGRDARSRPYPWASASPMAVPSA